MIFCISLKIGHGAILKIGHGAILKIGHGAILEIGHGAILQRSCCDSKEYAHTVKLDKLWVKIITNSTVFKSHSL